MLTYVHKRDDIQKIINYAPLYKSIQKTNYLKCLTLITGTRNHLLIMPL